MGTTIKRTNLSGEEPVSYAITGGIGLDGEFPLFGDRRAQASGGYRILGSSPSSILGVRMPGNDIILCSWRKSSASATSECVEVASFGESVLVRDSKQDFPHVLRFTPSEWRQFLSGLRTGKSEPGSGDTSGPRALQWLNWTGWLVAATGPVTLSAAGRDTRRYSPAR